MDNVLSSAVPLVGEIPLIQLAGSFCSVAGGQLSLIHFPIWPSVAADAPLLSKCLSFFSEVPELFASVLSHYSSAFLPDIPARNKIWPYTLSSPALVAHLMY